MSLRYVILSSSRPATIWPWYDEWCPVYEPILTTPLRTTCKPLDVKICRISFPTFSHTFSSRLQTTHSSRLEYSSSNKNIWKNICVTCIASAICTIHSVFDREPRKGWLQIFWPRKNHTLSARPVVTFF